MFAPKMTNFGQKKINILFVPIIFATKMIIFASKIDFVLKAFFIIFLILHKRWEGQNRLEQGKLPILYRTGSKKDIMTIFFSFSLEIVSMFQKSVECVFSTKLKTG